MSLPTTADVLAGRVRSNGPRWRSWPGPVCGWVDPDDPTIVCNLHAGHAPMRPGWKGHVPPRNMLRRNSTVRGVKSATAQPEESRMPATDRTVDLFWDGTYAEGTAPEGETGWFCFEVDASEGEEGVTPAKAEAILRELGFTRKEIDVAGATS